MRISQIVNYLVLAYAPFSIIILKGGVKDVPGYPSHIILGIAYFIGSQVSKGLIFASGLFDLLGLYLIDERLLTNFVNVIDFIFIYYSLKFKGAIRTERVLKKLPLSVGWAMAQVFLYFLVPFANGFRDRDFKFRYFLSSLEANYRILASLVSFQLVFHYNRTSFKSATFSSNLLGILIFVHFFALPFTKNLVPLGPEDVSFWEIGHLLFSFSVTFSIYRYLKRLEEDPDPKKS